jgi:ribonuclease VapC
MIVDTSALLAVILNEADEERFLGAMIDAPVLRMSAATWVESAIVVDRHKDSAIAAVRFDDMTEELRIQLVPVSVDMAYRARSAYTQFGRGNHPAALNYGDCFSYALAKVLREPLLFKGNDFLRTDIEPALKD